MPEETNVLIAGGGPVGLATAIELGLRGVETVVIEPRPVVSHARPRCKTLNVRTMEHLHRWGIADRVRERSPLPASWSQDIVFCTSLAGYELSRFEGVLGLVPEGDRFAELGLQSPQYVLEEVLREVAGELDTCTLVTGARVVGIEQSPDEVVVAVDAGGRPSEIRAAYAVGCDGARSFVREAVGSVLEGEEFARPNFGMVFRAPGLARHVAVGRAVHYHVVNPRAPGLMGPIDLDGTWWIISFGVDAQRGHREGEAIIAAAAGVEVEPEILSRDPWSSRTQIADRLRCGRVFLAGDAGHLNPPHGGHGLNTGIGDAVDLGWKIAAVLDGWADPGLLDSYEAERRPLQERINAEATENMQVLGPELVAPDLASDSAAGREARRRAHDRIQLTKRQQFHALDLILDWNYEAADITGGPQARVGRRLPHARMPDGGSLYDALGTGFTLLSAPGAGDGGLAEAAARRGIPLRAVPIGDPAIAQRLGAALILVRPDQHVAWHADAPPANADAVLDRATGRVVVASPTRTGDGA